VLDAPGVLGNDRDVDGDELAAVLVSGPAHGAVTLAADGSLTYTPEADSRCRSVVVLNRTNTRGPSWRGGFERRRSDAPNGTVLNPHPGRKPAQVLEEGLAEVA
jgi:hypothetical protein